MIPSGYKNAKVYCAVPTDGLGDLTFTRASSATRVASNGLIEKVRTNLCLQSNGFNTASWTVSSATVTSGQAGYDGTNNAYELTSTVNGGNIFQTNTQSGVQTYSVYAKGSVSNGIRLFAPGTVNCSAYFNLNLGTVGTITGGATAKIDSVGNGWFRCSISFDQTNLTLRFYPTNNANAQAAGTIFIQNSQLETGDIATDYIPTTTTAVSVGPVSGLPRLDYLNSTCPKLLLEPQRTNLVTFSEQFNNAAWTTQEVNVTANAAIAPDGTQSADNIVPTAISGTHQIFSSALVSSSQCAMSVFAKANGYTTFHMLDRASGSNGAVFNLANGTVTNAGSGTGTITAMGNGWYRCTAVATTTGVRFYVPTSASNFTGDGTSGVLLWGAQVEAGAYASSYIPTLAASVTRVAELAQKPSASALIGTTSGTAYMSFVMDSDTSADVTTLLGLHFSTSISNRIQLYSRFGVVSLLVVAGGTIISNVTLYDAAPNQLVNVAFTYGPAGVRAYVNGTQVYNTATAISFTETLNLYTICNRSGIDDLGKGQRIAQSLLFKDRVLTNAQLAELTTL